MSESSCYSMSLPAFGGVSIWSCHKPTACLIPTSVPPYHLIRLGGKGNWCKYTDTQTAYRAQGTESFIFDSVFSWCMPEFMKLCQANFLGFKRVKSQALYSPFVTSTKKNLYKNVYYSLIHNNRHLEMNKTSNNRSMNKQLLVFHTGVGSLSLL